MKCPKCGYLGFERVERCRNCGYDFSLFFPPSAPVAPDLELNLEPRDEIHPLDDLSFVDGAMSAVAEPAPPPPPGELPLFRAALPDDEPLITKASPPRPPLAVRRSTPDMSRARTTPPRAQKLNLTPDLPDLAELDEAASSPSVTPASRAIDGDWSSYEPRSTEQDATVWARCVAAVIDVFILLAIDAAVVYFTMQICGLGLDELSLLPRGPLLAFLLAQNGGYLVAFTAGGQTLGKMAAGIKVVPTSSHSSLDLSHAAIRELVWLVLAAPAGLGLLATVLSHDHRGIHDRFAGTRVVRASLPSLSS